MKQLMIYKCDKCGATYNDREDCEKCESSHIMPKKMVSLSFNWTSDIKNMSKEFRDQIQNDLDATYPQMIKILMENGEQIEYKPVHIKRKRDKIFEDSMKQMDDVFSKAFNKT